MIFRGMKIHLRTILMWTKGGTKLLTHSHISNINLSEATWVPTFKISIMDIYQRLEPAKADSSIIKSFAEQNMKWNPQSKIILVMYHKWLSIYRWVAFFSDLVV